MSATPIQTEAPVLVAALPAHTAMPKRTRKRPNPPTIAVVTFGRGVPLGRVIPRKSSTRRMQPSLGRCRHSRSRTEGARGQRSIRSRRWSEARQLTNVTDTKPRSALGPRWCPIDRLAPRLVRWSDGEPPLAGRHRGPAGSRRVRTPGADDSMRRGTVPVGQPTRGRACAAGRLNSTYRTRRLATTQTSQELRGDVRGWRSRASEQHLSTGAPRRTGGRAGRG